MKEKNETFKSLVDFAIKRCSCGTANKGEEIKSSKKDNTFGGRNLAVQE